MTTNENINGSLEALGTSMDNALRYEKTGIILRAFGTVQYTPKAIFTVNSDHETDVYRRVWLNRTTTAREQDSVVSMLADYVVVNPELEDQSGQFARHGRIIAQYANGNTTLESQLPEPVTTHDMVEWTNEIVRVTKLKEISNTVSLTHINLQNRSNLDGVPGLSYPAAVCS